MEPMDCDPFFDYSNYKETDELFLAVLENDLEKLKCLVSAGASINRNNTVDETLLQTAIRCGSVEIFNYLMSSDDLEIDRRGIWGKSALLQSVSYYSHFDGYFTLELLKRGADVNFREDDGDTFLHLGNDEILEVFRQAIEKGADVNAQNKKGETPLYSVCESGDVDMIHMLLYYSALTTIPSYEGTLPIMVLCPDIPEEQTLLLEEILFDHTFDAATVVSLRSLIEAMCLDFPRVFGKIVATITDVTYDICDLELLADSDWLQRLDPEPFKLFMSKFDNIVIELLKYFSPLVEVLNEMIENEETRELFDLLDMFFESDHVADFIIDCTNESCYFPVTRLIYERFHSVGGIRRLEKDFISDEKLFEIMYILYSYGFILNAGDMDVLYEHYGLCEIFKILLHMDITSDTFNDRRSFYSPARLYYWPELLGIDHFCTNDSDSVNPRLLNYYNHQKLKESWSGELWDGVFDKLYDKAELDAKIKSLPRVPSLLELSRNAARQFIVNKCHRKTSMHFYTILKWLPIGEINRQIIALEMPLYY